MRKFYYFFPLANYIHVILSAMRACSFIGKQRCRRWASRFALACLAVALLCSFEASAATIRSKSDMRLWETVVDRSRPLEWSWEDGADSATLSFSNRLTKACSSVTVARAGGAARGSCDSPVTQSGVKALVDVTLVQKSGGVAVAQESAVLAYVSGAGGGPITVRAMRPPERELSRLQEPRVYAVDPTWLGEAGESGYDIAWPIYRPLRIILR